MTTTPEDDEDFWPTFTLGPTEYEQAVADIARSVGQEITDWRVRHLDPLDGLDGTYVIDVTVRFQLAGMDFLVLFECKRHASPVKRALNPSSGPAAAISHRRQGPAWMYAAHSVGLRG